MHPMETTYSLALVWNLAEYNPNLLALALLSPASLKAARGKLPLLCRLENRLPLARCLIGFACLR